MFSSTEVKPNSVAPAASNIAALARCISVACHNYLMRLEPDCDKEWEVNANVKYLLSFTSFSTLVEMETRSRGKSTLYPKIGFTKDSRIFIISYDELRSFDSILFNKMASTGAIYAAVNEFVDAPTQAKFDLLQNIVNSEQVREDVKAVRNNDTRDPEKVYGANVLQNIVAQVNTLAYALAKTEQECRQVFLNNIYHHCKYFIYYLGSKRYSTPMTLERAYDLFFKSGFAADQPYLQRKFNAVMKIFTMLNCVDKQSWGGDTATFARVKAAVAAPELALILNQHKPYSVVSLFQAVGFTSTTSNLLITSLQQEIANYTARLALLPAQPTLGKTL